jgi:hypothetical protein
MWLSERESSLTNLCHIPKQFFANLQTGWVKFIISHTGSLTFSWPAGHILPTYKETFQIRWGNSIPLFLHAAIYLEVYLFSWTSQNTFSRETAVYKRYCVQWVTVSHFFSMLPSTLKYIYSVEPVRMHFPAKQPCTNDTVCNAALQHCTQYHLYTAVSRENAFWLVQRNRYTWR